jgi:hypothetical protein
MAVIPKMKTTVDLHVSGNGMRVVALQMATQLACASIAIGNSFQVSDMKRTANDLLQWLSEDPEPQTLGQVGSDE